MKYKSLTAPAAMMFLLFFLLGGSLFSQVRPHHIFDNNMVLQRDQPVKIWGWANPSERVKIEFGGQVKSTQANQQGEWFTHLDPMKANTQPQDMKVSGKVDAVVFTNVLVGDVWVLGGQSNMEMDLSRIFHGDAEVLSAHFPNIRLMTIPSSAGHLPKKDFERINEYDSWNDRYDKKGYWFACSPSPVATLSGLGYIFGRRIHLASQIPIGLIDASLGGTTVEAWLSPTTLNKMPENKALV
jgi:sialate O-acetylesterase